MKIVYIASEAQPFIKTGGLADVLYALPKKLSEMGHEVYVIIPKYDKIKLNLLQNITFVDRIEEDGEVYNFVKYNNTKPGEVNYYFLENMHLFERGRIYGDYDEDIQYATFCEMTLRFLVKQNINPDIIHCNDWQTGPIPYFLKTRYAHEPVFSKTKIVYTIHNLMYQGKFSGRSFYKFGYNVYWNYLNFMKIGLEYADIVNTVSPSYAKEIKYPYFAEGLEDVTNRIRIFGILNGIDYDVFNPKTTSGIVPFTGDISKFKKDNRAKLLERYHLKDDGALLISVISRLVEGKGLDLILDKMYKILSENNVKLFLLGSGDRKYEDYFNYLAAEFPDKVRTYIGFDEELANIIFAGSDLFLMPSRYEPCGLSQMIAMRFGTVPLVRETGGLKDSVIPFNKYSKEGNGFSFTNYNADDMYNVIMYAIDTFFNDKKDWNLLVEQNFKIDNSWIKSAKEYIELYKKSMN